MGKEEGEREERATEWGKGCKRGGGRGVELGEGEKGCGGVVKLGTQRRGVCSEQGSAGASGGQSLAIAEGRMGHRLLSG